MTKEERNGYNFAKFKERVIKMSAYKDLYYEQLQKPKLGIKVRGVLWKTKKIVEDIDEEGCLVDI